MEKFGRCVQMSVSPDILCCCYFCNLFFDVMVAKLATIDVDGLYYYHEKKHGCTFLNLSIFA